MSADDSSGHSATTPLWLRDFPTRESGSDGVLLDGRYRIIGLLGTGATSEVFLAMDETTGAPVVVKCLAPSAARDVQVRERFVFGARATMAVQHRNVARVFSVEEPPRRLPYVVMEALVGESLSEHLERVGAMGEPDALALSREIASALVAAHAAGIIHRDVKPGNLFLLRQPAETKVKLIDFGFAKDTRDPDAGPSSTNVVIGTAQYMAPEQILTDPVDARTDVYGFGAVMFRMLTGHLPFDLEVGVDLFSHQVFSPIPPPSWLVESLDADLEQVVLRCLRKHPENRYPSMQAVLDDLDRIASAQEIQPLPLLRDPDVYNPKNVSGRAAAETLAARFGAEPPPPETTRFTPESLRWRRGT
jgi:eukaryotic-like serine/threonine-protein kinase